MLRILRSLSRIRNVFLTKMDTLHPDTNSWNSLPDLLLLVKAGTNITFASHRKQSYQQCFSHVDGYSASGYELLEQPA